MIKLRPRRRPAPRRAHGVDGEDHAPGERALARDPRPAKDLWLPHRRRRRRVAAVAVHLRHKDLQTASRYIDRHGASSRAINALES